MATEPEVLDQSEAPGRARLLLVAAGVLLAVVLGAGAVLRSTLPPPPLSVGLASVDGSALDGESFVRLQVRLQSDSARGLGRARLVVAGTSGRGLHRTEFDGDGRLTVQVDVTPACPAITTGLAPGRLDLDVRDEQGRERRLSVDVPTSGRVERLLRYRCRTA